jgi:hypothetical protein
VDNLGDIETKARKQIAEAKQDYDLRLKYPNEYAMNLALGKSTKAVTSAGWRSNYFYPTIPVAIRKYVPRLIDGLIGPKGYDFFNLHPAKCNNANGMPMKGSADVITTIQNKHMSENGDFYGAMDRLIRNSCVFGPGYMIQGWISREENWSYYQPEGKDNLKSVNIKKTINKPSWYVPSTTDIFPDPAANTWKEVTFVCERRVMRLSQLKEMADHWNQKDRFNEVMDMVEKVIRDAGKANTSNTNLPGGIESMSTGGVDPVQLIWNIYEPGCITTMWQNYCIHYLENPFSHHHIPVYCFEFEPDFYRFAPRGLPLMLCDINEAQNDALNLLLDNWKISINRVFGKIKSAFVSTQDTVFEPGTIMNLNKKDDFWEIPLNPVNMGDFKIMQELSAMSNLAGGNIDTLNGPPGETFANKTLGGAQIVRSESNVEVARIIKHMKENGLVPMLDDLLCLYDQFFDKKADVIEIVGEEEANKLNYIKGNKIDWGTDYDYVINGDVSAMDKQTKLQNLNTGIQMLTQLQVPINKKPISDTIVTSLDLDKSIVQDVPPTPAPIGPKNQDPNAPPPEPPPPETKPTPLSQEQIEQIPVIAQKMGVPPELIINDLQKGIIPNFEALVHLSENPQLIEQFKAQTPQ